MLPPICYHAKELIFILYQKLLCQTINRHDNIVVQSDRTDRNSSGDWKQCRNSCFSGIRNYVEQALDMEAAGSTQYECADE